MSTINSSRRALPAPRLLGRLTALCGTAAVALLGAATPALADDVCPNAAIREAQGSTHLPNCMAYEWVSAQNPGGFDAGVDISSRWRDVLLRADGERILFYATGVLGESPRGPVNTMVFGDRAADGWQSRPGIAMTTPETVTDGFTTQQGNALPSPDFSRYGFSVARTLGPPNPVAGTSIYLSSGPGQLEWVSEPEPGISPVATGGVIIGGNRDFSKAYLITNVRLTTQAGDQSATGQRLYERSGGQLRLQSVLPDGTMPVGGIRLAGSGSAPSGASGLNNEHMRRRNQVSEDGRRVFFAANVGGAMQLYVREDGVRTRLLSHDASSLTRPSAEGVVSGGLSGIDAADSGYAVAGKSGSHVIFRSTGALAPGADAVDPSERKTYRADAATGVLTFIREITGSLIHADADASRVLWTVRNGLGRDLYLWDGDSGRNHLIHSTTVQGSTSWEISDVGTTDDGSVWWFNTSYPLDPTHPDTNGTAQVYRWEVGDAAARCLSCKSGATYSYHARTTLYSWAGAETVYSPITGTNGIGGQQTRTRAMSRDGNRVIFETRTALVPEDVDDGRDVYLWERGLGYSLITSGTDPEPSYFADASADGDVIAFITMSDLVADDRDGSFDVYVARANGGFPAESTPDCDGDGCQPSPAGKVGPGAFVSDQEGDSPDGPADLAPEPGRITAKRVARDHTGKTLKVSLSAAGTLHVGGRNVAAAKRSVAKKGAITIKVRLSRAAQRTLKRRGTVTVAVQLRFVPKSGAAASTVVRTTIKRKKR